MVGMEFFNYCKKSNQMEAKYEEKTLNSKYFWKIYESLLDIAITPFPYLSGEIDLKELKQNVIYKSSKILEDIDLSIRYLEEEKMNDFIGDLLHGHQNIIQNAHNGTIFDIPLVSVEKGNCNIIYYHSKFLDFRTFIYEKINIPLFKDLDIIETRYFHELGHALIDRNPYAYYIHLLKEYFPICMELFYSYYDVENSVSYQKNHFNRIMNHQRNKGKILDKNNQEKKYVICYLLAIITFEMYFDFSKKQREEMRNSFVSVLNGNKGIETFLADYEIDFENPKTEKMFRKTIERIHC